MPLGIYHRKRRNYGIVYCPRCLQADGVSPYYRTHWRLAFYMACPTCGIYLHECCPACRAPIAFYRAEMGDRNAEPDQPISTCSNCAFDLTQSPTEVVPIKQLRRYRSLYRISREGWHREVAYPHLYFTVLRQMLELLISASPRVQSLQTDMRLRMGHSITLPAGYTMFEYLPIHERHCLLQEAMWLLDDWPARFIAVMRYHGLYSSSLRRDMELKTLPFWFDSIVTEHFYNTNINRRFQQPNVLRAEKGRNKVIAPITGLAGGPRKYRSDMLCPHCGSEWVSRNGYRDGKQRFECQQCKKHFTHL